MQLHEIKRPKAYKKKSPRVGRGGKRGTTSGRGTKGQKARAGHRIRPAIRDLIQRLPKLRGFKNKSIQEKATALNLDQIEKLGLKVINVEELRKAGILKRDEKRAKILGRGEIKTAVTVEGLEVSKSAKEKLEKAGGRVVNTNAPMDRKSSNENEKDSGNKKPAKENSAISE
ncbi:MAG: 50S ribosomal protein L15 [bacterium]|nr:50S ribosomal protein L15 [bacterium]